MIELNKKAKPFNPCESVLGTELLFKVAKCRMIGSYYYLDNPSEKIGKDVLVRAGVHTIPQLKTAGWEQQPTVIENGLAVFAKEGSRDKVVTAFSSLAYESMSQIAELARYIGISEEMENYKKIVYDFAKIIMQGKVLVKVGEEFVLQWPPEEAPPAPLQAGLGGFGAGVMLHHAWAAHPMQAAAPPGAVHVDPLAWLDNEVAPPAA
jgi:hypothetical protein